MCIRDRRFLGDLRRELLEQLAIALEQGVRQVDVANAPAGPVSYTHLTLPTSDLV